MRLLAVLVAVALSGCAAKRYCVMPEPPPGEPVVVVCNAGDCTYCTVGGDCATVQCGRER